MKVLITGAAGMIGRKLTARLQKDASIVGIQISGFILQDIVESAASVSKIPVITRTSDLADDGVAAELVAEKPDLIFHLAGVVSGEAEANFEKGYRANLDGTRNLFEATRQVRDYNPRVVYTSSIAVFGGPFPEIIEDDFAPVPLNSYGVQKLMCEHLLNDYTRRGFIDGIGLRFPTICVRPGKPNAAASGFFSSIIREPLVGEKAFVPVPRDTMHTHASPHAAINFLLHAASINTKELGNRRNISLPGVAVSVSEQIESLSRVAGNEVTKLISDRPDQSVDAIVKNWPQRFNPMRALALGFKAESSFDDIIKTHIEDELSA